MTWFSRNKDLITGALLFLLVFPNRFLAVNQTFYASGWDGYYFVMQIHSWFTLGHLQSPDYSLVYPFLGAVALFTDDYVLAYKIGSALLATLLILSAWFYVLRQTQNAALALLCAAYIAFSPTLVYLSIQFPKNVMGLVLLIWFLFFLSKRNFAAAGIFLVLTFLTHRMAGGLCITLGFISAIRTLSWKYLAAAGVMLLLLSFLPGILNISDLQRFEGELSWTPQAATWSLFSIYKKSISPLWITDLIVLTAMVIFIGVRAIQNRKALKMETFNWIILIALAFFPFYVMKPGSIGFRFVLITPVVLTIPAISALKIKPSYLWLLSIFLLGLSFVSFKSYKPALYDPPNAMYEVIAARIVNKYRVSDYPLVIAHKGLAEMIIFKTDFDALNWAPPAGLDPHHVLRIIHNVEQRDFEKVMGDSVAKKFQHIGPRYYVASEADWAQFLAAVKNQNRHEVESQILRGRNPMDQRPYFLSRGKDL